MEILPSEVTTASSGASAATQSLTENFDNFLLMLTTQLQHQDPLSPTDATEFTNQLVQFSQLEQQISQSGKIEDLIALQQSAESIGAVNYLGKTVEVESDLTLLEDGNATFSYDMPAGAVNASIAILDSTGRVVKTYNGESTAGRQDVVWDGTDSQGVLQPDGVYTVVVSAVNADDIPFDSIPIFFTGTADAVWRFEGQTFVTVGPVEVPLDRILSVMSPSTTPTA
ncbi:MAG: flagellar hook assembly protein FlgD [Alphaproteobacteria bacterium]|nr:flagellar hook assembly protein FlgD [Alphaproteobacteria bacterium]